MIEIILKFLSPVLGALAQLARDAFADWRRDEALKQQGATEAKLNADEQRIDDIKDAEAIRTAVHDELAAHPEQLRADDGFKRD
jgi:hypothetical protein